MRFARNIAIAAAGISALWAATTSLPSSAHRPLVVKEGTVEDARGYVSSDACQYCHESQYASWYSTFHRTMTQVVSAETVLADFDGGTLRLGAQEYRLSSEDGTFWVDMPDPAQQNTRLAGRTVLDLKLPADTPRVRRQIVQSTGSHHYQLYWYPSGQARELYMLPFVWLIDDQRWVPRMSVFLAPPDNVEERLVWNLNCLPCHSTDGQPGFRPVESGPAKAHTRIAEAGIACEACHGPGDAHVATEGKGSPMVHPGRLTAERSAEVCGQCHSVNLPRRGEDWVDYLLDGPTFRPGDDLDNHRFLAQPDNLEQSAFSQGLVAAGQFSSEDYFWSDGEVRVTGREYSAVRESPCFAGGEFSCLSCHSMHDADPNDLLADGMDGDQACVQCHPALAENLTAHTHHPPESDGSRCYNCHMPHTAYGLLKAERSHKVTSPSVASNLATGRVNACNVCHTDRSLAWAQEALGEWFGHSRSTLTEEQQRTPEVARMMLAGDAGQRALAAYWLGWEPARAAVAEADSLVPILAEGLTDEYDTVRYIAARSLRRYTGFAALDYDFIAEPFEREQVRSQVLEMATASLLSEQGIRRLRATRDHRRVTLAE